MADESTTESTAQATSDGDGKNSGAEQSGAGTQTAQQTSEAQTQPVEKTFTQADVDRIIANRVKSGVKAELKKMAGDGDGATSIEDLTKQLSDERSARQHLEARQSVSDYLMDPKSKLTVKPESVAAIVKLVLPDIQFGDDGKPGNIKEAVEAAKSLAPALFVNAPQSIDGAPGRNGGPVTGKDMNSFIRQQAGYGN